MKKFLFVITAFVGITLSACSPQAQTSIKPSPPDKKISSLMDLLKSSQTAKCEYGYEIEGLKQKGIVYTANGKTRMDIDITLSAPDHQPRQTVTHLLVDGDYQYLWNDGLSDGTKIKMTPEDIEKMKNQSGDQVAAANKNQAVDWNQKMDFSCQPWQADASFFQLPSGVKFEEIDMAEMAEEAEAGRQKICDMCSQLSGEAKDQCLSACSGEENQ